MGDLYLAISRNNFDGVVRAVDRGIDINKHYNIGCVDRSFLYFACEKYILFKKYGRHVHDQPNIEIIKFLILRGANVNQIGDQSDRRPLHHVADLGCMELVVLLLDSGADKGIMDWYGHNAADMAMSQRHFEVAEYIREYNDMPVKGVNL